MDFRNIETFLRAAELGSFTAAAQELNYVQSTVTMQIQQLERELGYPLFDRVGRKVSLTSMGESFLGYARQLAHTMDLALQLDRNPAELSGTLRVGVLESLLFGHMLELLPRLKAQYPNLNLQLKMGQAADLLQQLKQNRLDMVYISAGVHTDPDLQCCYRREERLVFLCSPEHPAAKEKKISVKALLEYDFMVTEHSGICYGRLQELAARHDALLRTSVEVDSTVAITALIQNHMSLAFLPAYAVQKQLREGSLRQVDVDLEPQIYYSQILCHKSRWISPFMSGLIGLIRQSSE